MNHKDNLTVLPVATWQHIEDFSSSYYFGVTINKICPSWGLVVYDTLQCCGRIPTFRRILLQPSSI